MEIYVAINCLAWLDLRQDWIGPIWYVKKQCDLPPILLSHPLSSPFSIILLAALHCI